MARARTFTMRLPDDIREKLEAEAETERRTLSNLVVKILTEYVEQQKK